MLQACLALLKHSMAAVLTCDSSLLTKYLKAGATYMQAMQNAALLMCKLGPSVLLCQPTMIQRRACWPVGSADTSGRHNFSSAVAYARHACLLQGGNAASGFQLLVYASRGVQSRRRGPSATPARPDRLPYSTKMMPQ